MGWLKRILGLEKTPVETGPFPDAWLPYLQRGVACYRWLTPEQRQRLRDRVQTFIAEKTFIGHGDIKITDEMKVVIAGNACVLLVGIPEAGVFPRLREIIIHARGFGETVEAVGPDGRRYHIQDRRAGEAWRRGPVVLAWDQVRHSVASPADGYNVVYHEFAHVLDFADGFAQGVPALASKAQHDAWARVFSREYEAFLEADRRGERTFINPYGATGPEEFFAVLTEHFFEQPRQLRSRHPDLYEQLRGFFRQDPARWGRSSAWA